MAKLTIDPFSVRRALRLRCVLKELSTQYITKVCANKGEDYTRSMIEICAEQWRLGNRGNHGEWRAA